MTAKKAKAAKVTVETGLAVRPKLHKALASIENSLKGIKQLSATEYKTNGQFRWNPNYSGNDPINIHTSTDIMLLLSIYTSLRTKAEDYNISAKELNLNEYPVYTWLGTSWGNWKHDLTLRIAIVQQDQVKEDLMKKKEVLERHLTEEEQLDKVLDDMGFSNF